MPVPVLRSRLRSHWLLSERKEVLATQCQNASLPALETKALQGVRTVGLSEMATAAQAYAQ